MCHQNCRIKVFACEKSSEKNKLIEEKNGKITFELSLERHERSIPPYLM